MRVQIWQYAFLLAGRRWSNDMRLFFLPGVIGKDAVAKLEPNLWHWISVIFFSLYLLVLVCFGAFSVQKSQKYNKNMFRIKRFTWTSAFLHARQYRCNHADLSLCIIHDRLRIKSNPCADNIPRSPIAGGRRWN